MSQQLELIITRVGGTTGGLSTSPLCSAYFHSSHAATAASPNQHYADWDRYAPEYRETDVMRLFSAGTTFNDVRIPFPHVRVMGLPARSTLEKLRGEHPTATPIIVGGDENSLHVL